VGEPYGGSVSPIIRILGATSLNDESRRIDLSGLRPGELLSILALNAGEFVYRDHLLDALYGEDLPRYPRIQLQNLVLRLRRHLTPWENMIRTEPNGYRFVLHSK
jgi:DNA-binding response OmpR family regulator